MRAALLPALFALVGAVLAGSSGAQTQSPILARGFRIQAGPAYEGTFRMGDSVPLIVRIENVGPDAAGALLIAVPGESGGVRYPIALPRGAKKAIPVANYAPTNGSQVMLQTDRGQIEVPVAIYFKSARASLLAVGDGSGGLAFLEQIKASKPNPVASTSVPSTRSRGASYTPSNENIPPAVVAYSRPEAVPESEAALDRTSCIALMAGSERLNSRQIAAIRRYVLRGGHLVLIGGASAPILTDSRLADMVPYSALEPGEVIVRGRRVSIQRPTPRPGSRSSLAGGIPVVRRDYGIGRVSLFAADPVEGPLERVSTRATLVSKGLDLPRSSQMARLALEQGPQMVPGGTPSASVRGEVDPFSLNIPPTSSILKILGAYFIIVLPINFLVLRAFRRLELAWFTAPLLAIGFAGLLFQNAGSLYNTGLSHATQATVLAASGGRDGLTLGRSQIFFPNATRGPIPIEGAEAIGADLFHPASEYGYYPGQRNSRPLDVIVTDAPAVPSYGSTALEFRDVEYRQTIDLGKGIRVIGPRRWRPRSDREIEVLNGSRFTLREVRVMHGPANDARILGLDEPIPPGGRAVVRGAKNFNIGAGSGILYREVPMLVATIDGAPLGPPLGTTISSRTSMRILVSGEVR